MRQPLRPFHLAFAVTDLKATRRFYAEVLGCAVGRESERWIDFDFFGHQITAHLIDSAKGPHDRAPQASREAASSRPQLEPLVQRPQTNPVDGDAVPVRHFGAVLPWSEWEDLALDLRQRGVAFHIEPRIRFRGEVGEQGTFFLFDPCGNALEFKAFRDPARLFAH